MREVKTIWPTETEFADMASMLKAIEYDSDFLRDGLLKVRLNFFKFHHKCVHNSMKILK